MGAELELKPRDSSPVPAVWLGVSESLRGRMGGKLAGEVGVIRVGVPGCPFRCQSKKCVQLKRSVMFSLLILRVRAD